MRIYFSLTARFKMHNFLLSVACLLSLVYVTYCNPRLPESSHKSDGGPPIGEIEPLPEQMDPLLQSQTSEEQEKRDWNKLSGVWGKRGWNNLQNMWGKRENSELPPYWGKRGWNNLSNVWGKRGWNNLSNVWGKRGWNNLSNVWGKRGWNNLSNVWGKRNNNRDDGSKRTTNWNNLKSLWGKRDADWEIPTVWDRVPSEEGKT